MVFQKLNLVSVSFSFISPVSTRSCLIEELRNGTFVFKKNKLLCDWSSIHLTNRRDFSSFSTALFLRVFSKVPRIIYKTNMPVSGTVENT